MSEARTLGELLPGIIARAERMAGFQAMLNDAPTDARRKEMIIEARQGDLISHADAALLIQTYGLEAA